MIAEERSDFGHMYICIGIRVYIYIYVHRHGCSIAFIYICIYLSREIYMYEYVPYNLKLCRRNVSKEPASPQKPD